MAVICPSLTYTTPAEYAAYMDKLAGFAQYIHVDVSDGILAPVRSVGLAQAWWPEAMTADIHLMYERPTEHAEELVSMAPRLVIVHPEAKGDLIGFGAFLRRFGIKFGIAVMPDADAGVLAPLLSVADHALIFSGKLGYYGGHADPARFGQVRDLRRAYPTLEIGWDGGANESNVHAIARAGVDVINVGSGLSKTPDPAKAYATLVSEL